LNAGPRAPACSADTASIQGLRDGAQCCRTWKQTTSGANASGTLTVKEGTSSATLTLVGKLQRDLGRSWRRLDHRSADHGWRRCHEFWGAGSEGIAGGPGSGTTVHSGGYEFGGDAEPSGDMRQLDLLLSQFEGVISGFDLGDEVGPHSLGFGLSSSAWMREAFGADPGSPGVDKVRNPRECGHRFRRKAATQSDRKRPPDPNEGGHPVDRVKRGALSAI
jgi:hypothetical protein